MLLHMSFDNRDTERLNPMQSAVFQIAYNTVQNMLVCAPTGAGKTNIAMLAVLQLVRFLRVYAN